MHDPEQKLARSEPFKRLYKRLEAGRSADVRGPAGSGAAVVLAALMQHLDRTVLAICPGVPYAEELTEDAGLFNRQLACHFPAAETPDDAGEGASVQDNTILRSRMKVLSHLQGGADGVDTGEGEWFEPVAGTRLVCTSINAVLQPISAPETLSENIFSLQAGGRAEPRDIVAWLVERGFIGMPQVNLPGQYCLRGGILDVFPHGADVPVRVEFFGDEIDTIRCFDPRSQRSSRRISECRILAAPESDADGRRRAGCLTDYLPDGACICLIEPVNLWDRAEELASGDRHAGTFFSVDEIKKKLAPHPVLRFIRRDERPENDVIEIPCEQRDVFGVDVAGMANEIQRLMKSYSTYVFCAREAEEQRLRELLEKELGEEADRPACRRGRLNHGVMFPSEKLALIPHQRLFGRYRQRHVLRGGEQARPVTGADQLSPGDYVVHVQHGIGRFSGLRLLERGGRKREHMSIEFADGMTIYVPADRLELVHRYIGVGGKEPNLSRVQGVSWARARKKAEKAAEDLAAELLRLQALRRAKKGIKHPPDDHWQNQFEAEFPYEETQDQLSAITRTKNDMQARQPMDRLICGDVGYGKTEVAMRAAFKCVMGGRQAALVAPTTILAQQHRRTFRERIADYPVRVEMLSRFVSRQQAQDILGALNQGKVDIVVGTHRLLQKDVGFSDLGLLIIDEEQRFGVKHKEKLKKMRISVDILTLTATPIPRTLHMAMMGLRDISALQTPPLSRQAVETHVARYNPELVRHAVMRELNREGQVYFVHNRVHSIDAAAERVRKLVPEARVAVAHGRMPEKPLSEAMDAFCDGQVDVLVSTTIIENGLDIPNANTLIIDRAELLGLAEMHQLRGRVGRSIHKAYAYFLTPQNRPVTPEARKRLETIGRYSDLGAGFDIALRDLELRGAGNILGPEQSGHIAAVGYNLYCRLLTRAQKEMKGEAAPPAPETNVDIGMEAFLDEDYVPSLQHRIEIYRRLSEAATLGDIADVAENLRDRFGPLPQRARNLLLEGELRVLGCRAGLDSIRLRDGRFHLGVRDREELENAFSDTTDEPRFIDEDTALLKAPDNSDDPVETGEYLKDLLSNLQCAVPKEK